MKLKLAIIGLTLLCLSAFALPPGVPHGAKEIPLIPPAQYNPSDTKTTQFVGPLFSTNPFTGGQDELFFLKVEQTADYYLVYYNEDGSWNITIPAGALLKGLGDTIGTIQNKDGSFDAVHVFKK